MKKAIRRLLSVVLPRLMPNAVQTRQREPSMVFSLDDDTSQPSDFLISLALHAVQRAREISLHDLDVRLDEARKDQGRSAAWHPSFWPGDHYRLLAGLAEVLQPRLVVEIGTGNGLSALSMKEHLPHGSQIATFDILGWREIRPFTYLKPSDFDDGTLIQYLDDLSKPEVFAKHELLLKRADMMFIDGPKDGMMERELLENFNRITFDARQLVMVFDDIRFWNMLGIWRKISFPKLDLTSFGHWSGTGLVEWRPARRVPLS